MRKMTKKAKNKFAYLGMFLLIALVAGLINAVPSVRAGESQSITVESGGTLNIYNQEIKERVAEVMDDLLGGTTNFDSLELSGTLTSAGVVNSGNATVGGTLAVTGASALTGQVTMKESVQAITLAVGTTTIAQSGTTFVFNLASTTAGSNIVLPAVTAGINYRYTLATSSATTTNIVIDSAEGDNIVGSLVVDGTAVPCDFEDQMNFVSTAEAPGDFFELISDGTLWYVNGVGEASGSVTCTDPS